MSAKLLVYLDYLLKNSTVPMMLKLDPEKLSPDEILEINKMVAASICPNCGKFVNGVNPYDDGETWIRVN